MIRVSGIRLPIDREEESVACAAAHRLHLDIDALRGVRLIRKSVDARQKSRLVFVYTVDIALADEASETLALERASNDAEIQRTPDMAYLPPTPRCDCDGPSPVVVGAGPCGLFAALLLAELGMRPILLERGKPVLERMRDVHAFWRTGALNPASNALFGEGGAGAFSDGKLTTQIKERGNRCRKVLEELAAAGAPKEILHLHKPHIGTDILMSVVAALREKIAALGGTIRFNACVTDIDLHDAAVTAAILQDGERIETRRLILATGHSARDTYAMLDRRGVTMQPKPFSIGARLEHPQSLIDFAQYGMASRHPALGPADYKLVHHCRGGRSVYTFCMCPGGEVIASASEPGGVVTNGMSVYRRDAPNANAAVLVGVGPEDFDGAGPLAGIEFQRRWETAAYSLGGGAFRAPAQRVEDFLRDRASTRFDEVAPSYRPGVTPANLSGCLPDFAAGAMREAFPAFGGALRGFNLPSAVLTGVETRSSAPVRIPRGENFESVGIHGLYPAGEGAGYAGGIVSAAVDGLRVAEAVIAS